MAEKTRKNDCSNRLVFITTVESEAVDVELPVVATYNDSLLASQILKNRCP
jgi:hypothetical protein